MRRRKKRESMKRQQFLKKLSTWLFVIFPFQADDRTQKVAVSRLYYRTTSDYFFFFSSTHQQRTNKIRKVGAPIVIMCLSTYQQFRGGKIRDTGNENKGEKKIQKIQNDIAYSVDRWR